ncbi:MAG: bifunctional DNA primase/polymerase [Dactylosporangium sp.]|nr:bifunctional DNA primase/polymerase [Dactylosporangium sp.]
MQRTHLARPAARYAEHGWEVLPGAFLSGPRFDCGRPGCPTTGCHPAVEDWEASVAHDAAGVAARWRRGPYAVLLATGRAFDVLEVPERFGQSVIDRLPAAAIGGPIAVAPEGRWMFLLRPGHALAAELTERPDIVLHGRGSWVPAPPTQQPNGRVRWQLHPRRFGYRVADPLLVQSLVIAALPRRRPRPAIGSAASPALPPVTPPAALDAPVRRGNIPDRFDRRRRRRAANAHHS